MGGTSVQITYTAANLPDTVADAKGHVTKYTYTAWNDVDTVTVAFGTPLAATTTTTTTPESCCTTSSIRWITPSPPTPMTRSTASLTATDGDNVTTTYTYDTLGRLDRVYDPRLTGVIKTTSNTPTTTMTR